MSAAAGLAMPLLLCPVSAGAQGNLILSGLTFPPHIGGSDRTRHTNFEKQKQGLGHSVEYDAPDWRINVYIYDLENKPVPPGIDSPGLAGQFEQAGGDILTAQKQGVYSRVAPIRRFTVSGLDQTPRFKCGSYAYRQKNRGDVDSFLCLGSYEGKYLKFRATTEQNEQSETAFRQYLGAWIDHLWPGG